MRRKDNRWPTSVGYPQLAIDRIFATMYYKVMNTEQIEKIRKVAKRTLRIIALIEEGCTSGEIVARTGANRQLVDYYQKIVK